MGPVDSSSIHQSLKCVLHTKAKDYFKYIKLGQVWKKKRDRERRKERKRKQESERKKRKEERKGRRKAGRRKEGNTTFWAFSIPLQIKSKLVPGACKSLLPLVPASLSSPVLDSTQYPLPMLQPHQLLQLPPLAQHLHSCVSGTCSFCLPWMFSLQCSPWLVYSLLTLLTLYLLSQNLKHSVYIFNCVPHQNISLLRKGQHLFCLPLGLQQSPYSPIHSRHKANICCVLKILR